MMHYVKTFAIVAVSVAIIMRVEPIRKIVVGS